MFIASSPEAVADPRGTSPVHKRWRSNNGVWAATVLGKFFYLWMDSAAVAPLPALVAGLPFGIAFAFGAIAEIANFGDWKRRRIWMMAIGVAIVGTTVRATLRLIDHSKSTFTGARVARGRRG